MPDAKQNRTPLQLFYSYAHEDEEFRNALEKHLWWLHRQGEISGWHDRRISAGSEWAKEINRNLEAAHIILLLISPDFVFSEYCYDVEMTRAIERHDAGEARVIPVLIRDVDNWQAAPFGKLQAVPKDAKPVNKWSDKDEAWVDVARSIRLACEEMRDLLDVKNISPSVQEKSFNPSRENITFSGNTIELANPSDEDAATLVRINSVSQDIPYGQVAGVHGNRMPQDIEGTQRNIDEMLELMAETERERGGTVKGMQVGGTYISHASLLLKKAILLQAEAEEAALDLDLSEEEKEAARRAKLKESYELLRKANKLEPANTEVLLNMAQLLVALTPDDPGDEQKILSLIRKLLSKPMDETQEFRLARATYLMAMTSRPPNVSLLREARSLFQRLDQTKWVEQCDELLKTSGALRLPDKDAPADPTGFGDLWETAKNWRGLISYLKPQGQRPAPPEMKQPPATQAAPTQQQPAQARQDAAPQTPRQAPAPQPAQPEPVQQTTLSPPTGPVVSTQQPVSQQQPTAPAQFQPFGQWHLKVNDAIASQIFVNFIPNGICFGSQFSPGVGHIQFNGRWGYNPYNRLLNLQGLINGVQPFMLNIIIHGPRGQGFYGVGSDGYGYFLTPRA